jgi:hypothetical protein
MRNDTASAAVPAWRTARFATLCLVAVVLLAAQSRALAHPAAPRLVVFEGFYNVL